MTSISLFLEYLTLLLSLILDFVHGLFGGVVCAWTSGGDLVGSAWDSCTFKKMFTVTGFSEKVLFMLLVE